VRIFGNEAKATVEEERVCVFAIPIRRIMDGFELGRESKEVRDWKLGVMWSISSKTTLLFQSG
jgi:hypothetical protein